MEICESEKIAAIKLIRKFEKKTEAEMKTCLQQLDSGFMWTRPLRYLWQALSSGSCLR